MKEQAKFSVLSLREIYFANDNIYMVPAEYEKRRLQIHGYARTWVLFDSNAAQGTSSNSMRLGDWSVEVPGAKKEKSFGAYAGMGLDIAYRLDTDSPRRVVGDVGASRQGYENSGLDRNHNRERQWRRAAAGIRRLKGDNQVDARLKAEVLQISAEISNSDLPFNSHQAKFFPRDRVSRFPVKTICSMQTAQ
jgi:hypothetical protein